MIMILRYLFSIIFFALLFSEKCLGSKRNNFKFIVDDTCECGTPDDLSFRIVGGEEVKPHTHPWMVLILNEGRMHCGGALINDRYVLTAAHCLKWADKNLLSVTLGVHKTEEAVRKEKFSPEIEEVIVHERFTSNEVHDTNDIGLIKLKYPVKYTSDIRTICLPRTGNSFASKQATVLGWGRISSGGRAASSLQRTNLTILSNEECRGAKSVGPYIIDSMLCAIDENTDACQGDSGGPLVYNYYDDYALLIGIVSWGIGCATPGVPGVYTRITHFLDWIYYHTKGAIYCKRPDEYYPPNNFF